MKRQLLVIDNLVQHVTHMVKLGLAVVIRIINAIIDYPVHPEQYMTVDQSGVYMV